MLDFIVILKPIKTSEKTLNERKKMCFEGSSVVSSISGPSLLQVKSMPVTPQRLFWLAMQNVKRNSSLHSLNSATQPQCYRAENTWPFHYDSCIWFCKWAEFWEVRISDQLHTKSIDDMQTPDMEIQILFDLIYNSSLQYFTLFEKSQIVRNRNRLILPCWLYNICMPKCWLCTRRFSSWLIYLNNDLCIVVLKCKNLNYLLLWVFTSWT